MLKRLLDRVRNTDYNEEYEGLKVELRETENKGYGLFAIKPIKKGEVIAYYKIRVFKSNNHKTDYVYAFDVYRKNGVCYTRLMGDLYKSSFPDPENGITFLAPFANEPIGKEKSNSEIDIRLKETYQNKKKQYLLPGDVLIYHLKATKKIKAGDEILWDYGENYDRSSYK